CRHCGWRPRSSWFRACAWLGCRLSGGGPEGGFRTFDAIAGGIAEIDGARAVRPAAIRFDGDARFYELFRPEIKIGGGDAETDVSRAARAMRGNGQPPGRWRHDR